MGMGHGVHSPRRCSYVGKSRKFLEIVSPGRIEGEYRRKDEIEHLGKSFFGLGTSEIACISIFERAGERREVLTRTSSSGILSSKPSSPTSPLRYLNISLRVKTASPSSHTSATTHPALNTSILSFTSPPSLFLSSFAS